MHRPLGLLGAINKDQWSTESCRAARSSSSVTCRVRFLKAVKSSSSHPAIHPSNGGTLCTDSPLWIFYLTTPPLLRLTGRKRLWRGRAAAGAAHHQRPDMCSSCPFSRKTGRLICKQFNVHHDLNNINMLTTLFIVFHLLNNDCRSLMQSFMYSAVVQLSNKKNFKENCDESRLQD